MKTLSVNTAIKFLMIFVIIPALTSAQQLKEPAIGHVKWFKYLGIYHNMYIGNRMPFTDVAVSGPKNNPLITRYLIDFGTDTTVVDLNGIPGYVITPSNDNKYSVSIDVGNLAAGPYTQFCNNQNCTKFVASGITESGIIGTDILSQLIVTLDYKYSRVYLWDPIKGGKMDDLSKYGFVAVTAKGYYKNHPASVPNHNNDPMIPIVIGDDVDTARAIAFMDPGLDDLYQFQGDFDNYYTHCININQKYLSHLQEKNIGVKVDRSKFILLSNVAGNYDTLFKCSFAKKYVFNAIGLHSEKVIPYSTDDCNIFLKVNGPGGASAGGITTNPLPAAQFGGSILMDCDEISFDPFTSLVWFRQKEQ